MASITFRCDDELKKDFDDILDTLNIKQTDIFINTMKYIIQNQKQPFIMTEILKTPEDIRQDLIHKLMRVEAFVKELDLLDGHNINEGLRIVREYVISFNNVREQLKEAIPDNEYQALQSAYNHAYMLSMALSNTTFDNEGRSNFPPDFKRHLDWMSEAFRAAIK